MLSERQQQFYNEVLKYARKGYEPTYKEIVQNLPHPESKYYRQIVHYLESSGYIVRRNRKYVVPPVGLNNVGQSSFIDGVSLEDISRFSDIVYVILSGVYYQTDKAAGAVLSVLDEIYREDVLRTLAEAWLLYTFITDHERVPRIKTIERHVEWADFLDDVKHLTSVREKKFDG